MADMPEKPPLHLKAPTLQTSPEVERAVKKHRRLTGEKIPNNPGTRIDTYIGRLEKLFLNKDEHVRERNIEMLRPQLHAKLVSRQDVVIDEMLEAEARIAREQGHGDIRITSEMRQRPETLRQAADIIERQEESLNAWVDYLSSDDIAYPAWFRYYVFSNVIGLQALEKREKIDEKTGEKVVEAVYPKRNDRTLKPFPDIYRGKLAKIQDMYAAYLASGKKTDADLEAYFKKSFAKVYAEESLDHIENAGKEGRAETRGKWVKYRKSSEDDARKLVESLKDKYTDWCTEGYGTAKNQISRGDFYVFYTYDEHGKAVNPRIAIRMEDGRIGEMRGISGGRRQEVEDVMLDEADKKLKEFGPEADEYKKKSVDMKRLTRMEQEIKKGIFDNKGNVAERQADLRFLYEIDSTIKGFGYQRDPRVKELRDARNPKEDAPAVFGCAPEEVAWKREDINENTKAYVGPLFAGVFAMKHLEYVWTSFPEGRIGEKTITVGGKDAKTLERELKAQKKKDQTETSDYAFDLMTKKEFTTRKTAELAHLVHLSVADLGFTSGATTREIHERAKSYGLGLCPPDAGPQLRLQYAEQPNGEYLVMAMEPIVGSGGHPSVFGVGRDGVGGAVARPPLGRAGRPLASRQPFCLSQVSA